jgi:flagellar hook-associated protein 3 FlgL
VLNLKGLLRDGDQYARNITTGNAWLAESDSAMAAMGNIVVRARELAQGMANGTYDANARATSATELKQLKNQLIQLGNSQVAGRYIFGGFVSDRPPFDTSIIGNPADPLNGTPSGAYLGTDDAVNMEVDRGAYVSINYSGGTLLRGGTPPGSAGVDIVGQIDSLITAMAGNDIAGVQAALPGLEDAQNQILNARGDVGARMNRVEGASSNLESVKLSLSKVVSDKQDVDFLQVMSDLTQKQGAFEAALSTSARLSQLSLLDYLR